MNRNTLLFVAGFILWNVIVFFTYGYDKHNARHGRWRVSEYALLAMAFLMGGIGAFLGMRFFRHKTRHAEFVILIPFAIVVNVIIYYFFSNI